MNSNFEPVLLGRSKVIQSGGTLSITVPAPFSIFGNIFLLFWLVGWTIGGIWASGALVSGPTNAQPDSMSPVGIRLFLGAWLCLWFLGEIAVIYQLFWSSFGREIITLDMVSLKHRWSILGFGRTRYYELKQVKNLRAAVATSDSSDDDQSPPKEASCIAFDYGRGSVHIAQSIDSGEAYSIIEQMFAFNRSLRPRER